MGLPPVVPPDQHGGYSILAEEFPREEASASHYGYVGSVRDLLHRKRFSRGRWLSIAQSDPVRPQKNGGPDGSIRTQTRVVGRNVFVVSQAGNADVGRQFVSCGEEAVDVQSHDFESAHFLGKNEVNAHAMDGGRDVENIPIEPRQSHTEEEAAGQNQSLSLV